MKSTRKFDGKIFKLYDTKQHYKDAEYLKEMLGHRGFLVRITGGYKRGLGKSQPYYIWNRKR